MNGVPSWAVSLASTLIASAVSFAVMWGATTTRLTELEKRDDAFQKRIEGERNEVLRSFDALRSERVVQMGELSARVLTIEKDATRIARLEEQLKGIGDSIRRIEGWMEAGRGPRPPMPR